MELPLVGLGKPLGFTEKQAAYGAQLPVERLVRDMAHWDWIYQRPQEGDREARPE
jgi:hypothetical protein